MTAPRSEPAAPPARADGRFRGKPGGPGPLLDSALASFYAIGYGGTSVRTIAQGADMTVAAVYHYFESKQEMLVQIMTAAMEENLVAVRAAHQANDGHPDRQLFAMISAIVGYHTHHQAEAFVGGSELRSLEDAGRAAVVKLRDEEEDLFRSTIREGLRRGIFSVEYPILAARAMLAMSSGVAAWYRSEGALDVSTLKVEYGTMALKLVGYTGDIDAISRV